MTARKEYLVEAEFKLLFESIPGLYMILSRELLIIGASDAYLAATMVKRADVIGRPLFEIFPDNPADIAATGVSNLGASLQRVIDEGVADTMAVQKYDVRRPQADGGEFEVRYWSPTNSPVFDTDGQLAFIVHRAEDVTEYIRQKQAENEQTKLTEELRSKTETMSAEIYRRAQELQTYNKQLQNLNQNLRDEMQAREQAESAVRQLNTDLQEHAARIDAYNRELEGFSYSISHDLRAPLRAIDGYSQMLEMDYRDLLDEEGKRFLTLVRHHSKRMGLLIDDLLRFSKLGRQSLKSNDLDVQKLVGEVVAEALLHYPEPKPQVVVESLPRCNGDGALLQQVWENLVSNAIKYSSKAATPVIRIQARQEGSEQVFSIVDNGAGFDMAYYEKLFGVFERLHGAEEFSGTGVGLAIVKRVIERHGGRVWAEGELGRGATFYFALPA